MTYARSKTWALAILPLTIAVSSSSAWTCERDLTGHWEVRQSNGYTVEFDLIQIPSGEIRGNGEWHREKIGNTGPFGAEDRGPIRVGRIAGNSFTFVVEWPGNHGEYWGTVKPDGSFSGGRTRDLKTKAEASWSEITGRRAPCALVQSPPPSTSTAPPPKQGPSKILGRYRTTATANNDVDIYNGPGGQFTVIGMLKGGTQATVTGQEDGWYKLTVSVPGGTGWVAADHLKIVKTKPLGAKQ